MSGENLFESLETVLRASQDKALVKVLVDAREQTEMPSVAVLYEFGAKLARFTRHLRHAVVISPKTREALWFVETVSQNRGAVMEIFDSMEAAQAWLNE